MYEASYNTCPIIGDVKKSLWIIYILIGGMILC